MKYPILNINPYQYQEQPPAPQEKLPPQALEALSMLRAGLSPETWRVYEPTIREFTDFWQKTRKSLPVSFANWVQELSNKGLNPATVNKKRVAVRRFAEQMNILGYLPDAELKRLKAVKGKTISRAGSGDWITEEEAAKVLESFDVHSEDALTRLTERRDLVLFALMIGCGLRRSCVTGQKAASGQWHIPPVTWGQVREDELSNIQTKRGKTLPSVAMAEWVGASITLWKNVYCEYFEIDDPDPKKPLLCSFHRGFVGKPLSGTGVDALVRGRIWKVLNRDISSHDLRRSFATIALIKGKKNPNILLWIQRTLGHDSIETTRRYIKYVEDEGMANEVTLGAGDFMKSLLSASTEVFP